jgi:hypothetical protein
MIRLTRTLRSICAATIAAGVSAGFVARCDELLVQEPSNENPILTPESWIGKQVVTKYGMPDRGISAEAGPDRISRVYTVKARKGDQVQPWSSVRAVAFQVFSGPAPVMIEE